MKTAFVGLGVMGFPMARHLKSAGHEVSVYNRSPEKARRFVAEVGGSTAETLAEAVRGCELVALCVGNDDDVRECLGKILPVIAPGGVVVDHTTTSAKIAREAAAEARITGAWFVDAPVSGGQAGAEAGQLSIMCGGDEEGFAKAEPVIAAYAKAIRRIGGPGAGQLCKMVNQICIAGVVQGLAEAVHFAKTAGIDTDLVLEAVSKGAAQSWQMENRWKTMVQGQFEFGFAVDWMRKDLGLVLDEARSNGARLEVTALVDQFYAEVQSMGGRRWDTSSLAARLER
ncbi:NAD(P)-dependent oxidoreductase [Phenylobacterium montanum]|uniref:NAD(P)-dependent oxidoreductase n=1 Tax=Phenylobacterium montanum TaxID=2823693 RepID=A0A975G1E9_9CAUL|nr:NAD(P)-dependent oxidoreductase [Caulobacter sp. S6]QUD89014.1 NAD(P)-dependent oxidoreductase [Caulobacter sp. S6]